MKTKDIIIGRKYINTGPQHAGVVYLGIGYKGVSRQIKGLVIIEDVPQSDMIGVRVIPRSRNRSFWNAFIPK